MNIEVPFNYLNIFALSNVLKYENQRSIEIKLLNDFRETFLKEVIRQYNDPNHRFLLDEDA